MEKLEKHKEHIFFHRFSLRIGGRRSIRRLVLMIKETIILCLVIWGSPDTYNMSVWFGDHQTRTGQLPVQSRPLAKKFRIQGYILYMLTHVGVGSADALMHTRCPGQLNLARPAAPPGRSVMDLGQGVSA